MKTPTSLALTLALSGGAIAAQASEVDELAMAVCRAELETFYGTDARFDLVDKKRFSHGTRMKVAARVDADNVYFATCWVDSADLADLEDVSQESLYAVTEVAPTGE